MSERSPNTFYTKDPFAGVVEGGKHKSGSQSETLENGNKLFSPGKLFTHSKFLFRLLLLSP